MSCAEPRNEVKDDKLCADIETKVRQECQNTHTYEDLREIANFLLKRTIIRPKIGIILGTGLGSVADNLTEKTCFPYETIPKFPVSTVMGHEGSLVFGFLLGVPVICMKGRFHFFEGYPAWTCAMPVRVMKLVGVTHMLISNAAGGVDGHFEVGDLMIIKDHINFIGMAGQSPLRGINEDRFGSRFPPMNLAYDKELRQKALAIAKEMGIEKQVHEGVYACLGGPQFETVAEIRMLKVLGVDAVGMSTVHEVITACHCDMKVIAFSLITNICVADYESCERADHTTVLESAKLQEDKLRDFVSIMVQHLSTVQ